MLLLRIMLNLAMADRTSRVLAMVLGVTQARPVQGAQGGTRACVHQLLSLPQNERMVLRVREAPLLPLALLARLPTCQDQYQLLEHSTQHSHKSLALSRGKNF